MIGETSTQRGLSIYESSSDLDFFDRIRHGISCPERSDVCEVRIKAEGEEGIESFHLRHLSVFVPLLESVDFFDGGFEDAAAAILAVHHFNNRIDEVVPQIADAAKMCSLKFTVELFATDYLPGRWQKYFFGEENITERTTMVAAGAITNDILPRKQAPDPIRPFPTALVGAMFSETAETMASISGFNGIPTVGYSSEIHTLDNKDEYPLFGRVRPASNYEAYVLLDFLWKELHVTHLGLLIEVTGDFAPAYVPAFKSAAAALGMQIHMETFVDVARTPELIQRLKDSQYRYFYGRFEPEYYGTIMSEAYRQGIAGEGNFWIFNEPDHFTVSVKTGNAAAESAPVAVTHGVAVLESTFGGSFEGQRGWDAFSKGWSETMNTTEGQKYFHSKIPDHVKQRDYYSKMANLSSMEVSGQSVFNMYDAIIAAALAACKAAENDTAFGGEDLHRSFLHSEFDGANGKVVIDPTTGSRDPRTVPYTILNVLASPPNKDGNVIFSMNKTYNFVQVEGDRFYQWQRIEGTEFIYSDGSTIPPDVLPPQKDYAIGRGALIAGLVLCAVAICVTLGFAVWTTIRRNSRIVRASQPEFLGMLCLGALMIGSTILPLSMQYLGSRGAVCMAIPWLFSTGFTFAFSALYSKTLRINTIFRLRSFRRVTVKTKDVMKPFGILFLLNVITLTLMTAISPLTYGEAYAGSDDMFGRPEYYGSCLDVLGTEQIVFVALLFFVNFSAALLALIQAWDARFIKMEYNESRYIFISVLIVFESFVILLPLLPILSPTSRYAVWIVLVSVVCLGIMMPMFVPKIIYHRQWEKERAKKAEEKRARVERSKQLEQLASEEASQFASNTSLSTTASAVEGIKILDLRSKLARGKSRRVMFNEGNLQP